MGAVGRLIDWHNGREPLTVAPSPPPAQHAPVSLYPVTTDAGETGTRVAGVSLDEVHALLRKQLPRRSGAVSL
jgi:hypothetical protein